MTVRNYTTCLWRELSATNVPNVDPSKTTLTGCTEKILDDGNAKGRSFFFLSTATDNVPDNPQ